MILKKILVVSAMALLALSCSKEPKEEPLVPQLADYVGTVTVGYQGSSFDNENISVQFQPAADGKTASILINQIRFVPQMPVKVDVTIPDVNVEVSGQKLLLSCESVIPLAMGGPYTRYPVTGLTGTLEGDSLSFDLKFGDSPTSFRGTKK